MFSSKNDETWIGAGTGWVGFDLDLGYALMQAEVDFLSKTGTGRVWTEMKYILLPDPDLSSF